MSHSPSDPYPVLIIEDNKDHQLLTGYSLRQQAPYVTPLFTDNVHDALAHLKTICEEKIEQFPRLVLLDLCVPRLTDGWHALTQMRTLYPHLPVLAMSSQADPYVVQKAYGLGAYSFVTKPTSLEGWGKLFHDVINYWMQTVTLPVSDC